jgi:diaminohydroxyphosphoribosylaminopyrimidine deaminase/5-amino-6-(5-phosphoribosylamino)uracil reductase
LDRSLRVPQDRTLFDGKVPTIVFTEKSKENMPNCEFVQIDFDKDIITQILQELIRRNIQSLLVEGGSQLLQTFIDGGVWDEIQVEEADVYFQKGVAAPSFSATLLSVEKVSTSEMHYYRK